MSRILPLVGVVWIAFAIFPGHAMQRGSGRSLALVDDGGLAVLTWDGAQATLFRNGEQKVAYAADSWEIALWHHVSAWGGVTSVHRYDRALSAVEVSELGRCGWAPTPVSVDCGTEAVCDCSR
ncbi:MAG: hypothetical protein KC621_14415 [Myxococcales bacterium]|nr:hypothetical protein [Myxococcales bacterium]